MDAQQATILKMQALVMDKALKDPSFKAELLANPRAKIESTFKLTLPAHIQIQVQEAAANTVVVTLPHAAIAGADGELSDSDLEAVAGGSKSGATAFFEDVGSGLGVGAASAAIIPMGAIGEGAFMMDVANITLNECF